jgi:hypothetical protein
VLPAIAALSALALAGAGGAGAATGSTPKLDRFDRWSLRELGGPEPAVLSPGTQRSISVQYELPKGASQGVGEWYIIHLQVRVAVAAESGNGVIYVQAKTDDHACALVEISPRRQGGGLETRWNAVGIIDGIQGGTQHGRTVSIDYRNYLQVKGVQPGLNTLTIEYQELGGAHIERVDVLPGTALERTRQSPALVNLGIPSLREEIRVGEDFVIPFKLRNDGDRSAGRMVVEVQYPHEALRLRGTPRRRFALGSGPPAVGNFDFKALAPGTHVVGVFASTRSNRPGAELRIRVLPAAQASGTRWSWALVVGAAIAGAAVLAQWWRRRGRA